MALCICELCEGLYSLPERLIGHERCRSCGIPLRQATAEEIRAATQDLEESLAGTPVEASRPRAQGEFWTLPLPALNPPEAP